jgi:2-isopropylmalate synthase
MELINRKQKVNGNQPDFEPDFIWIYDTTLRDGCQREGMALSVEDKLQIARLLDRMGIPFIEGGWPGANPKDVDFFSRLKAEPLTQAEVVAFCSTRRPGKNAAEDPILKEILSAETLWVTIFGKSWDLQVREALKTTLAENLAMIQDTISFLQSQGRRVIYDAEHWFDGYKHNPEYALQTLETAIVAGAEWLVFCDTNGGTLPDEISEISRAVIDALTLKHGKSLQFGIHAHNDSETAVANSLAAVKEGVRMVQGTINGYGERCGNANLCSLIPNLQIKQGFDCFPNQMLTQLTSLSRKISDIANIAPDDHAAFVGYSAFAHKGGIHVSAVQRNPITYEHIQPESIGNSRRIVVSEQAGLSNILAKACDFGVDLDQQNPACRQVLQHLKYLENQGYEFEAAEASLALMMHEAIGDRKHFFKIQDFQVFSEKLNGENHVRATVKVAVNEEEILAVAENTGPIAALDRALRKALLSFYPEISQFQLTDYKVRILDTFMGTHAKSRVLVEFTKGSQRWNTIGVSLNILDASCEALAEGLEYGLLLQQTTIRPGRRA